MSGRHANNAETQFLITGKHMLPLLCNITVKMRFPVLLSDVHPAYGALLVISQTVVV